MSKQLNRYLNEIFVMIMRVTFFLGILGVLFLSASIYGGYKFLQDHVDYAEVAK